MYQKQGFTLIELLVVVLIIGILSAVALPQYQTAVEKSRAAEALVIVRALINAQELYRLSNGVYSNDINDLDVEVPGEDSSHAWLSRRRSKWFSYAVRAVGPETVIANRIPEGNLYTFLYNGDYVFCRGFSAAGKRLCKSFGGEKVTDGSFESYKVN